MDIFSRLQSQAAGRPPRVLAIANAADPDILSAVQKAVAHGLVEPLFSGNPDAVRSAADLLAFDISPFEILSADTPESAALLAVRAVAEGRAGALMKGLVPTAVLLKAVLDRQTGIRGPGLLSHLACFVLPALDRPVFLTDAAINIAPDVEQKIELIKNAVQFMHRFGYDEPVVGVLAAIETVNPAMQATVDADLLVRHQHEGRLTGCLVGGPYALDNALFPELARLKGMNDPLAGRADLLLAPNIEAGNVLYKSMALLAGGKSAGLVIGARAPIVLTSRADSSETKLNAITLALAGAAL